ncbi:MAG: helix-turn-helix transcriptional regulator [Bacteroidetes bacterium]|jgi:transcriptional regulator with XRE-family HTH domain|nr:helix-turn-helix transcriptional regulator [Bacteroidota bacterium]
MITGRKLHLARNIMGYSQEYMAIKLQCSQRTISKWENGEVALTEDILNKYLGVLEKDKEWVDTLDDRINIVQNNHSSKDSISGYIINNHPISQEITHLVHNLSELVKAQQELLEHYKERIK